VLPSRVHRRRLRMVLASVLSVIFAMAMTGQAHADPTIPEVEAHLDELWQQAEPMIEEYNAVHEQYLKNKAKQDELEAAIAPYKAQLDAAQDKIGAMAARAYMGGQADAINVILGAASPRQLVEQLGYLDGAARLQTEQLSAVIHAKVAFDAQKGPIDTLVNDLAAQDADLAAKRKAIEERLDELQALRIQAYGTSGGIGATRPWVCPAEYLPTPGYKAAAFACGEIGKSYVWGAAGPRTYDCSGLTMVAWQHAGVYLPHNAAEQRRSMPYVNRADLQIGDLVFYYSGLSHVAIYVGDGKVVHAPRSGDVVRMVLMDRGAYIHSFGRP
jgi:peptidoglycan DL-endopeptidase CwlO